MTNLQFSFGLQWLWTALSFPLPTSTSSHGNHDTRRCLLAPVLDCSNLCLGRGCRHKARAHPAQTRQFIIQIMIHISLQPSPALRLTTVLLLPVWDGIEARQSLTKASLSSSRGRPSLSQKFSNCVQHLLATMLHIIKPVCWQGRQSAGLAPLD